MTDEHPTTDTCRSCGTEFSLVSAATPCPTCGKKIHRIGLHAESKANPDMEARGIPPGRGKSAYFQKVQTGYEFCQWFVRQFRVTSVGVGCAQR
jgi:hypothetical protein